MIISEPFIVLTPGKSSVCMGCGIDQIAAPHTGHGDNRYFLIPDPQRGDHLCPVCFFARYWQQFAQELQGQIIFSEAPQSLISLSFYFKQISDKAALERNPNLALYNETVMTQIIERSNSAVAKHLPGMQSELLKPNTDYLAKIMREITLPQEMIARMRYLPHSKDFEILTYCKTPSEQLDTFLNATQFNQEMIIGGRSYIAQAVEWYNIAYKDMHL